jgi:peptidoglycan/xylan/chitin deacetylase (PgdA/CDA1 family)
MIYTILSKVFYYTKNLKYLFNASCVILLYHRVTDLDFDPQQLSVTPQNFENQIKFLRDNFNIITLKELIIKIEQNRIPKNTVVITFDDGYADNFYEALPVLEKYSVPATVFVTSNVVTSQKEFWWDQLEFLFLNKDTNIPEYLDINIGGTVFSWKIGNETDARRIYKELHAILMEQPIEHINRIIDELNSWAEVETVIRESHSLLSINELQILAKSDLIEIGAHTISHPRLINENHFQKEKEILQSKKNLEKIINKEVLTFSYPFGTLDDFDGDSVNIVRDGGYIAGIANIQDKVNKNSNLYFLPRRVVRNWDVIEFKKNIEIFFKTPENWFDFFKMKLIKFK